MRSRLHRLHISAAVTVLAVLAAGCSSGGGSTAATTPSPVTTAVTTTTQAPATTAPPTLPGQVAGGHLPAFCRSFAAATADIAVFDVWFVDDVDVSDRRGVNSTMQALRGMGNQAPEEISKQAELAAESATVWLQAVTSNPALNGIDPTAGGPSLTAFAKYSNSTYTAARRDVVAFAADNCPEQPTRPTRPTQPAVTAPTTAPASTPDTAEA